MEEVAKVVSHGKNDSKTMVVYGYEKVFFGWRDKFKYLLYSPL